MHLTNKELDQLDRRYRANIINSVSGIKSANLIGTKSKNGQTNVAIFNSVFHLGANPPLQGFVLRPTGEVPRHTYENIKETGYYTINHVTTQIADKAHYTSAKLKREESEFKRCGLTEEYLSDFHAPFVKESPLKIGLRFVEEIPIKLNDTVLIIGEIEQLMIPDQAVDEKGHVDLSLYSTAGISGLNSYYSLQHIATFPYARPEDIPNFGS